MSKSRRPSAVDPSAASSSGSASGKKSKSSSSSAAASTADFLKQDDTLQAVLLADSFTQTLRPITLQQPKVLLPLLNTTLLDYALEFLVGGGVQELFVFCSAHADKVREHVGRSRLLKRSACAWRVVVGKGVHSEGDALRHLDQLDLIKGDFVLMSGDIVTNLSLPAVLQQHRARAQRDKSLLMSVVMKQVQRSASAAAGGVRSLDDDSVIGLVPSTGQLLLYHNKWSESSVELHSELFTRHPCVQYRYDLYDTHILICTPAVLMLCLTGDHQVLTRSGWQSIKHTTVGTEVASFNVGNSSMEWKKVRATQRFPSNKETRLYRMTGSSMDIVATGDHRMLVYRMSGHRLSTVQPIAYQTVDQLRELTYSVGRASTITKFAHTAVRAIPRAGHNLQPAVKLLIPGLEAVCGWWWANDKQHAFLRFIGFWLGDGHLQVQETSHAVVVGQRKEVSTTWLIDLLNEVFPRWWYRNATTTDDKGTSYNYFIRCPPLYDWLREMAAGPLGYNPRDSLSLASYPHFAFDQLLADAEKRTRYRRRGATPYRTWTEAAMLETLMAGDDNEEDDEEKADEEEKTMDDDNGGDDEDDEKAHDVTQGPGLKPAKVEVLAAGGVRVVWNDGEWEIIDGHWYYIKRWIGPDVADTFSRLSQLQAAALLEGFCRADGKWALITLDANKAPIGHWQCKNSSFPLIHHLQLIGQLAGALVDLCICNEAGTSNFIDGREVKFSVHCWQLDFNWKTIHDLPVPACAVGKPVDVSRGAAGRGHMPEYKDDGYVYDITVEDNGNFLTQRLSMKPTEGGRDGVKAHAVFVGNCQDNFDYQSIRRDFIPGILGQEDILDKTIYAAVLSDDAYAVHVGDLHTYAAVSREIVHRWSYPHVPDLNIVGDSTYRYERGNRYREEGVTVARDATVGEDTVLGRGTTLAEGSSVRRTVVGRDCSIGARSRVSGSFVWSGVSIGAGCVVDRAILCDGVTLGANVRVERGAILSYGVEVADGQVVRAGCKVTRVDREDSDVFEGDSPRSEDGEATKREVSDEAAVGKGGKGRLYVEEEVEEEDEEEDERYRGVGAVINSIAVDMKRFAELYRRKRAAEVDDESDDEWDIDERDMQNGLAEDDEEKSAVDSDSKEQSAASDAAASHLSTNGTTGAAVHATGADEQLPRFYGEAIATLQRGHTEQLPVDAIVLEMASLKLSHDASMAEYVEACLLAMVSFVPLVADASGQPLAEQRRLTFSSPHPSTATLKALLGILRQWSAVLAKFGKHRAEQVTFLDALARLCKRWQGALLGLTGKLMLLMVEQVPLVDEEAVWEWETHYRAEHGEKDPVLLQASEFLTWLKEAEEDEESGEEEGDEADEEDD